MPQLPTTLGDLQAPSPQRRAQGYNVPQGPNLQPLEAGGQAIARSQDALAQAGAGVGKAITGAVDQYQQQQDHDAMVDAADRENKLQAKVQDYLYNPDTGYLATQRGKDAVDGYGDAKAAISAFQAQAMDGMTNKPAMEALSKSSGAIGNGAVETLDRHVSEQKIQNQSDVLEGTYSNANDMIAANPSDQNIVANSTVAAHTALVQQARLKMGRNANPVDIENAIRPRLSAMTTNRIDALVAQNTPSAISQAGKIYQDSKIAGLFTASDDNHIGTLLKTAVPAAEASTFWSKNRNPLLTANASADTLYTNGQAGPPGDKNFAASSTASAAATLMNSQVKYESGGKQAGGAGSVLGPDEPTTSSAGAVGIAQVLPSTAQETAQKHGLPWDENKFKTDAGYNQQLGTLYLGDQMDRFHDNRLALAAYNAGPGRVQKAIDKLGTSDPDKVLAAMPSETQAYVSKVLASVAQVQAQNGQGYDPAVVQAAANKLPPDQRPYFLDKAQSDHATIVQNYSKAQNEAIDNTQIALANAKGNKNDVSPAIRAAAIKYGIWDTLSQSNGMSDPAKVMELEGASTDTLLKTDFNNPDIRMRLSAEDLQRYQKEQSKLFQDPAHGAVSRNIDAGVDYAMIGLKNPLTGQPVSSDQIAGLRRRTEDAKTTTVDENGNVTDQNGKPVLPDKDNAMLFDKRSRLTMMVKDQVKAAFDSGDKLAGTPEHIQNIVDNILIDQATGKERVAPITGTHQVPGSAGWMPWNWNGTQAPNSKAISDIKIEDIPDQTRAAIKSTLERRNVPVTEASIMDAYVTTLTHVRGVGPFLASQRRQ